MSKMKNVSISILLSVILLVSIVFGMFNVYAEEGNPNECYYVALTGSDSNDGSISAPFKTLEKARDAVRDRKSAGTFPADGMTIYLREGTYFRDSTFLLTSDDDNTSYKAYPGEKVEITGKKVFPADKFQPVTGTMKNLLSSDAQSHVVVLNLPDIGLDSDGIPKITENYVPDMTMPVITDNGKYVPIASDCGTVVHDSQYSWQWIDVNDANASSDMKGFIANDFIGGWTYNVDEMFAYGYYRDYWSISTFKVTSINNGTNEVRLEPYGSGLPFDTQYAARIKLVNAYEALDSPGEWYVDYDTDKFYYYPLTDLSSMNLECSWLDNNIISVENAQNITIQGIDISGASLSSGVTIYESDNISVLDCEIFLCGEAGVFAGTRSKNCTIDGCEIHNIGKTGIHINTLTANSPDLKSDNNLVSNNDIYETAWNKRTYGVGIRIEQASGNIVRNNDIHDLTHMGIYFDGPNNQILNNDIFRVLSDCADSGAIYSVKNMRSMGTVIKNNHIHDSEYNEERETYGIYLDDSVSGVTMESNILGPFAGSRNPIFIHKGQKNVIARNIIIDHTTGAQWVVASSGTWEQELSEMLSAGTMVPDTAEYSLWFETYPWLKNLSTKTTLNNTFDENVLFYFEREPDNPYVHIGGGTAENYFINVDNNTIITSNSADYFTDAEHGKYQLTAEALTDIQSNYADFSDIVFDNIGINKNNSGQSENIEIIINNSEVIAGNQIKINVTVNIKREHSDKKCIVFIPLYDNTGKMIDIKAVAFAGDGNDNISTTVNLQAPKPSSSTCKVGCIILDENCKPLADAVYKDVSGIF